MSTARDTHPYRDLPGSRSKHLQDALFPPWIIRHGSMTAWGVRIVSAECALKSGRWCAARRAPGIPAQRYTAVPLEGVGAAHPAKAHHDLQGGPPSPVERSGRGVATGGPGATLGVERVEGRRARSSERPFPPASYSTPPTCSEPQR